MLHSKTNFFGYLLGKLRIMTLGDLDFSITITLTCLDVPFTLEVESVVVNGKKVPERSENKKV